MLKYDIFENIEEYNPNKKQKLLTAFDGMIADILSNTKRNSIVNESFIIDGKLNTLLVFITQLYFTVPKI